MAEKIYGEGDRLPSPEMEDTAMEFEPGIEVESSEDEEPEEGEGEEAE